MRSLRLKITLLNVIAVSAALLVATVIGVVSIATFGHESSEQSLRLLCQDGKNSLDDYFDSVEQSAEIVSAMIDDALDDIDDLNSASEWTTTNHIQKADALFAEAIEHTKGVMTYYYRIDPAISNNTNELGFWYVEGENGLEPHTVTPITEDTCIWFNIPKTTGESVWLLPYSTDSIDEYVISYNVPVYQTKGSVKTFVGVVGIEISYRTLGQQIKDIKAMESGFAFIVENENGTIIYHPSIDLLGMKEEDRPLTPPEFVKGLKGKKDGYGGRHVEYTFQGVKKHSYILTLNDEGMSVVVCVPISEINDLWLKVVGQILVAALVIVVAAIIVCVLFARHLTKPLKDLTIAAEEINKGNYDVKLDYKGNDEIGLLTTTFNGLIENLGGYINDLNALAYADALTEVRNRSAYEVAIRELQRRIDDGEQIEFAIALFDCDDLKCINDEHGHDKGNVYLRNACHLICRIFNKSVVYRIGGDEFVVILQGEDYKNREKLKKHFVSKSAEICKFAKEKFEHVRVSVGLATYDPKIDGSAKDVAIHADHLMYENKRERKKKNS